MSMRPPSLSSSPPLSARSQRSRHHQAELTRCIAALLSIFPSASPSSRDETSPAGGTTEGKTPSAGGEKKAGVGDRSPDHRDDHPPELTHRCSSIASGSGGDRPVNSRAIAEVDLEWLGSVAQEFNVVYEGVPDESGDAAGSAKETGVSAAGGGGHRGKQQSCSRFFALRRSDVQRSERARKYMLLPISFFFREMVRQNLRNTMTPLSLR